MNKQELEHQLSIEFGGPAIGAWPRNKGEKLRPHKGGGGGDGGAAQMEADRQARIKAATDRINQIFNNKVQVDRTVYRDPSGNEITKAQYDQMMAAPNNGLSNGRFGVQFNPPAMPSMSVIKEWVDGDPANSRERLYDQQRDSIYELNTDEVNRQFEEAERQNRFGLARSGLMGGSVDIDSNAELMRRTNEGLLRAGGIADQSAADLRTQDEQARQRLISMAQSGLDTGAAESLALSSLSTNAESAAAQRNGATIGSLFNDLGSAYLQNQVLTGGATQFNPYSRDQWMGVSSPRTGDSGRITR